MAALITIARDAGDAGVGLLKEEGPEAGWESVEGLKSDGEELQEGWVGVNTEDEGDLDDLPLWVEIKKQVAILREGMKEKASN